MNDQLSPSEPVANAVVSNDWDATTTTTDADGSFRLPLTKRVAADEFVVVTVRTRNVVFAQPMLGALHKNVRIVLPTARPAPKSLDR